MSLPDVSLVSKAKTTKRRGASTIQTQQLRRRIRAAHMSAPSLTVPSSMNIVEVAIKKAVDMTTKENIATVSAADGPASAAEFAAVAEIAGLGG